MCVRLGWVAVSLGLCVSGWLAVSLGLCVCQVRLGSCVFGSLCVKLGWVAVSLGLCVSG